jgi:A/G-specific adenine glycosylase
MAVALSHKFFTKTLLAWNNEFNDRKMPWKGEKDPYKIWLSEVILQQTRVEQGLEYYNKFIAQYPTVKKLAAAEETVVFKLWEGLGYYSRCKNLMLTAKYIAHELKGIFPKTYQEILGLKGVGPYTAAAISSFAYNLPYAVVDGNVFRVLSRFFGMHIAIDSTEGKKEFSVLANKLIDKNAPAAYNQALMDFGAVICKPALPLCNNCVLSINCKAFSQQLVNNLPVKSKKLVKKTRYFYYILAQYNKQVYVQKRAKGDIWENLYQFILIEQNSPLLVEEIKKSAAFKDIFKQTAFTVNHISSLHKQQLTHQTIIGQFITLQLKKKLQETNYQLIDAATIRLLPFPKFITSYLQDKNVSLNLF